jgi:CRP-like cAMP-binding protein
MMQLLRDPNRSIAENKALIEYLSTLTEFTNLAKAGHENYNELMAQLSLVLKYEKSNTNKIIIKNGERGHKFYIILRGKVGVLIPKDELVDMDEEEFMLYLVKLRKYEEHDLIQKSISVNKHIFNIDQTENFDQWLIKQRDGGGRRFIRYTTYFMDELDHVINNVINNENNVKTLLRKPSNYKEDLDDYTSIDGYINRLKPVYFNKPYTDKYKVYIFQYVHVHTLYTGNKFGELALIHPGRKRTATIIALEDTHMAILDKNNFDECLKELNEKLNRINLHMLVTTPIFEGITKNQFQKYFFNYFVFHKFARGHKLISENEPIDNVYFLKEGEYEIYFKKSLLELNNLILNLGG